jgi:hypothetical protein
VDQLGWNFTRKNGLCALNFFFLRAGKFFGWTSHCSISILLIWVVAFAFFLCLQTKGFFSNQSHILVRIVRILFSLSLVAQLFSATWLCTFLFLLFFHL